MSLQGAIEHSQAQLEIFEEGLVRSQYAELLGLLRELQERRSAPLYSPVKPEDVIPGYYWLVTPDGEKTIEQIWDGYGHGALGMESPEGWVTVSEIYELGGVLYRVQDLEVGK